MTAAPTTPVTWDRDPACSATAVRDPLVLTGKPWNRPAAMFAAPMPIISWSPRTLLSAAGGERRGRRHRVGEGDHGDGERPGEERGTSPHGTAGTVNGGNPCGSTPMVSTPWA